MVEVGLGEVTKLPSTKYLRGLSHARIPARWVLSLLKLILCQRAGGFGPPKMMQNSRLVLCIHLKEESSVLRHSRTGAEWDYVEDYVCKRTNKDSDSAFLFQLGIGDQYYSHALYYSLSNLLLLRIDIPD